MLPFEVDWYICPVPILPLKVTIPIKQYICNLISRNKYKYKHERGKKIKKIKREKR